MFCFQRNSCECLIDAKESVQGKISGILWVASGDYWGSERCPGWVV